MVSLSQSTLLLMRELSQDSVTSLFDAPPPTSYLHAKEFVRWCCGFGSDFRNSPDVLNLRYWARKNDIHIVQPDEVEVLETARSLFLKRVEQAVRRAGAESAETLN